MPQTWSDKEILDLMEAEVRAYRMDCSERNRPRGIREELENVLAKMKEKGLIEDTP